MTTAITSRTMTELEAAIQAAAAMTGPRACGIDISGKAAIYCLVPANEPHTAAWATAKARVPGILAAREIAIQTRRMARLGFFDHVCEAWIERPYGQASAIDALARTAGAVAASIPATIPISNPSSNTWRRVLGIRLGKGAKERAQTWAWRELQVELAARVARDDNAADSYGIARAILSNREGSTTR